MSIGISIDKAPVTLCAYRSDGETIPWIVVGADVKVGDIVERAAATQASGIVSSLDATQMTEGSVENKAVASAGDTVQLRVYGMIYAPIASAVYADGDRVAWGGTNFAANATGAHEIVGGYTAADTHALVRMNQFPGAVT